ncbi:MAG: hypothetical protein JW820_19715 [Spirochaetales bacterium]|nr:hypothetical protein [Spirochaetales bacterium]
MPAENLLAMFQTLQERSLYPLDWASFTRPDPAATRCRGAFASADSLPEVDIRAGSVLSISVGVYGLAISGRACSMPNGATARISNMPLPAASRD